MKKNGEVELFKEETLDYWEYWKNIKINESTLQVERISFEMTINGIKDSIKWHKAIIDEYDEYVKYSQSLFYLLLFLKSFMPINFQ